MNMGDAIWGGALAGVLLATSPAAAAEYGTCKFNSATLRFAGSVEQTADCLLRRGKEKGTGGESQQVPDWLVQHMSKPVSFTLAQLQAYLLSQKIDQAALGVGIAAGDSPNVRYFVIHDTSSPEIMTAETSFPANINDASWSGNNLNGWAGIANRVNLVVSRDGRSRTLQPWRALRPSPATKLEQSNLVPAARRVFVHVENIQPRLKPPGGWGWRAPNPGFGPAQEQRLALAYIVASFHAGRWLIPAYHFNVDEGLSADSRDDPQNADLASWVKQIALIEAALMSN